MIQFLQRLFAAKPAERETPPAAPQPRLPVRFAALKAQGRKALIPYISAGDPDPAQTAAVLHALVARLHAAFDAKQPLGDTATAFIRDIRAHLDKEPT